MANLQLRFLQTRSVFLACLVGGMVLNLPAKTIYVDGKVGNDGWAGTTARVSGTEGPLRTFARATGLLAPGDTLSISRQGGPYRETLSLVSVSGEAGNPIVVEGNGAEIELGRDVSDADWRSDGNGWVCDTIKVPEEFKKQRCFGFLRGVPFVINQDPDPKPYSVEETPEGLLRIYLPADRKPPFPGFYLPEIENGVPIRKSTFIVVRNLNVRGAANDGISFHGPCQGIVVENFSGILCGDEGASAHGAAEGVFKNCLFAWNGSNGGGVVDVHQSKTAYEDCISAFNRGAGYNLIGAQHKLTGCFAIGNTKPESSEDLPESKVEKTAFTEIPGSEAKAQLEMMAGQNALAARLLQLGEEIGWQGPVQ